MRLELVSLLDGVLWEVVFRKDVVSSVGHHLAPTPRTIEAVAMVDTTVNARTPSMRWLYSLNAQLGKRNLFSAQLVQSWIVYRSSWELE